MCSCCLRCCVGFLLRARRVCVVVVAVCLFVVLSWYWLGAYLIASRRPPGRAVWQWFLDVWMADRQTETDRQTDRQTDSNSTQHSPTSTPTSTPHRPHIGPKSTPNRPQIDQVGLLRPQEEQEEKKYAFTQWLRSFFCALDRSWIDLEPLLISTLGPNALL